MRWTKTHRFLHTTPFKVRPLSWIRNIGGRKHVVFAYFGLANAIGVHFFQRDCQKPMGFCELFLLQLRARSRIRNIRGHEPIVFCILWLRKCDRGISQRKLQKV